MHYAKAHVYHRSCSVGDTSSLHYAHLKAMQKIGVEANLHLQTYIYKKKANKEVVGVGGRKEIRKSFPELSDKKLT